MVAITKATLVSSVYENFYDVCDNVTSVTLKDGSTSTIQTYTSAFPDKDVNSKSKYPILIINSPDIDWEHLTFTDEQVSGTIDIEIFTTKAEAADKFIDAINTEIESNRSNLRALGLQSVNLESMDKSEEFRGKIKVHVKSSTFSFEYLFTQS